MYGSWDMDCDRQFFVILDNFLSFYPPKNLKNQNFEKLKKAPGDIIILQMHPINENHMTYGFCDIKCNRQIFLPITLRFYPP